MKKYVAYLRVSSKRQKVEGISLQAQAQTVARFTTDGVIIATFSEAVSGSYRSFHKRHQLKSAIRLCKEQGATLVIAVTDRLSRSVYHTAEFLHSGVDFIMCDMPECTREMLLMSSIFAEHEHRRISDRAKAAHAYKRSKGIKHKARKKGSKYTDAQKLSLSVATLNNYINDEHVIRAYQISKALRLQGLSYKDIAYSLKKMKMPGFRARLVNWDGQMVSHLLKKGDYIEGKNPLFKVKDTGELMPVNIKKLNEALSKTAYKDNVVSKVRPKSILYFDMSGEAEEWLNDKRKNIDE